MREMDFKKGDKVRFVRDICTTDNAWNSSRNDLLGKVFTIDHKYRNRKGVFVMREDSRFIFWESELELVEKNKEIKIDIIIDPRDSARAHEAVDEAIAEYRKKYFDWTEEELKQARELFKELAEEWVLDRLKPLIFYSNANGKMVQLLTNTGFEIARATANNDDVFNHIIGKVVCLCKALNKPIPDFINNKNR